MRFVYDGKEDIVALPPGFSPKELESGYTEEKFFDDMARVTQNRADPDLCEILVRSSKDVTHCERRPRPARREYYSAGRV